MNYNQDIIEFPQTEELLFDSEEVCTLLEDLASLGSIQLFLFLAKIHLFYRGFCV